MHSHLTKQTRIQLGILLRAGVSLRGAAKLLGVHHSSLSGELRRNKATGKQSRRTGYHARDTHSQAKARKLKANQRFRKILPGSRLEAILVAKIAHCKWAPEQCSRWLRMFRRSLHVCAQTIYDWIYRTRRDLLPYLHCQKGKYRRTRQARVRKEQRAQLAAPRHISRRPQYIAQRKTYGHWEGDTVHGNGKSGYIATFVECKSGYIVAVLLPTPLFSSQASPRRQPPP